MSLRLGVLAREGPRFTDKYESRLAGGKLGCCISPLRVYGEALGVPIGMRSDWRRSVGRTYLSVDGLSLRRILVYRSLRESTDGGEVG